MATIADIKKTITDNFTSNPSMIAIYGLDTTQTFEEQFSLVSFENILFYIIAVCTKIVYDAMDVFTATQQAAIDAAYIANDAWWYTQIMAFKLGYQLVFNATTFLFEYNATDPATTNATPLIGRCAVRQKVAVAGDTFAVGVTYISVLVSKADLSQVTGDALAAFTEYLEKIKPSGVLINIISQTGDLLNIGLASDITQQLTVYYDPMLIDSDGVLLEDGVTLPVNVAVQNYLADIVYGGQFNQTKLINAIQAATGVVDVYVPYLERKAYTDTAFVPVSRTFDAIAGFFILNELNVVYFPQSELQ